MSGPIVKAVMEVAGTEFDSRWKGFLPMPIRASHQNNMPHRDEISMKICTEAKPPLTQRDYQLKTEW